MITVIIPVHNGGALFRQCIESLARQDSVGAFDVVVFDNCSTDGGLDSLRMLPADVPCTLFRSDRFLKIEDNWARIAQLTDVRPFITILSHDDMLDPNFISTATTALTNEPAVRLLLTHFRLIDESDRPLRPCRPMAEWESAGQFVAGRLAEIRDSFGTGYVMRSDDYREVGGIPRYRDLVYADDALWVMLARRSGIRILDKVCFSYRMHSSSTFQKQQSPAICHALSEYTTLLQTEALRDPTIQRALTTYGASFINGVAAHWMLEEVSRACRENELARLETLNGWIELRGRFLSLAGHRDTTFHLPNELVVGLWANRNPLGRRLWSRRPTRRLLRAAGRLVAGSFSG